MNIRKLVHQKSNLKEKYGNEMVYILPFEKIKSIGDNFTPFFNNRDIIDIIKTQGRYVYRYDAEGNPSMQQIIPYVLVQRDDGKFFVTKRISGDSRLEGFLSLGIGGHIDKEDGYENMILNGLEREVREEVIIKKEKELSMLGYVRDLSSSTKDHTGLVFLLKVKDCKVLEKEKLEGYWYSYQELEDNYTKFESWGKYMIDHMLINSKENTFNNGNSIIIKKY